MKDSRMAPDGGYGWVIVACALIINILTFGTLHSLSVLFVAWLEEFHAGRGLTSWVLSIAVAIALGIGPVPAQLAMRFGYRVVVLIGGLMASIGFLLSSFASSIYLLFLTIGVLAGSGSGFCFFSALACVTMYFDQRRAAAIGIAVSGVGIGSFVFPPLFHWMNETYGWRGTVFIFSASYLNMCVCGLLMRPLPASVLDLDIFVGVEDESKTFLDHESGKELQVIDVELLEDDGPEKSCRPTCKANNVLHYSNPQILIQHEDSGHSHECRSSLKQIFLNNDDVNRTRLGTHSMQRLDLLHTSSEKSSKFLSTPELCLKKGTGRDGVSTPLKISGDEENRVRKDILMSGSLMSLIVLEQMSRTQKSDISKCSLNDSTDNVNNNDKQTSCICKMSHVCDLCYSFLSSFSVLKSPVFFIFTVSSVLANLSYIMPVLYMVDRAIHNGIVPASAAILVSINGVGNLFGRIFFGFLADRACVDRLVTYVICMVVCGVATSLSPMCGNNFVLHGIYSFVYGTLMGSYVTLSSTIPVDIMGVSMMNEALACVYFFIGLGTLIGPPLAGGIITWTGSYSTSFVLHGIFFICSGLILLPVLLMQKCQGRNCFSNRQ